MMIYQKYLNITRKIEHERISAIPRIVPYIHWKKSLLLFLLMKILNYKTKKKEKNKKSRSVPWLVSMCFINFYTIIRKVKTFFVFFLKSRQIFTLKRFEKETKSMK